MKLLELGYVSQGTGFHKKWIQFSVLNGPSPSNVTWTNTVLQSMCHMINKIKRFPLGFLNKYCDVFRQLNATCLLYWYFCLHETTTVKGGQVMSNPLTIIQLYDRITIKTMEEHHPRQIFEALHKFQAIWFSLFTQ